MSRLIGITGYAGSGKDTVASYLVNNYGYTRLSFADKLREVCSDVFNLPMEVFTDTTLKEQPLSEYPGWTPRGILIQIGTPGFRTVCDDVWINYAKLTLGKNPSQDYVLPDVRFENEAHFILDNGGKLYRIEREGCELGDDLPNTGLYKTHPELLTISNNNDLPSLYRMIDHIIKRS